MRGKKRILISGGAGYIGSHVVKHLKNKGYSVRILDNLSNGHREAVQTDDLVVGNIEDEILVKNLLIEFSPSAVIHFAAFIEVGESVVDPLKYYRNNISNTLTFLKTLTDAGVNSFIFSSTAALYGIPEKVPISETCEIKPINPYGHSKAAVERALKDLSNTMNFNYVALRYFNAAGASQDGDIGEAHNPESHLIPLVLKAAKQEREHIRIFGTDYPTEDGTCIRDYIHVDDLASAHVLALEYLMDGGQSDIFNCGYGKGYSVKEIINTVKKVTGRDFTVIEEKRRLGDPPCLIADSTKLKQTLKWKPEFDCVETIVRTAWNWEKNKRF